MLDFFALAVALIISAIAAFYSIVGLTSIFSAVYWPIVVMGSALELGKIVTTVWLRKNWKNTTWFIKIYLSSAIIALMLLTSVSIFGFLAKAHSFQSIPQEEIHLQEDIINKKIISKEQSIKIDSRALEQLDNAVEETMARSKDANGALASSQLRRRQQQERDVLQKSIETSREQINKLQENKAEITAKLKKVEAEVGPIKYIAAMIYSENPNADLLERAVRWVILLIVAVFDPLALSLVLAVNRSREIKLQNLEKENTLPEKEMQSQMVATIIEDNPNTIEKTQVVNENKDNEIEDKKETNSKQNLIIDYDLDGDSYNEEHEEELNLDGIDIEVEKATFGIEFPKTAVNGDKFLRVDQMPNKVFEKMPDGWFPVTDKEEKIIECVPDTKYLLAELSAGNITVDDLTDDQCEQIRSILIKEQV